MFGAPEAQWGFSRMPFFPPSLSCEEANFQHSIVCVLLLPPIEEQTFFLGIFTGRSKGDGVLGLVFRLTDLTYKLLYKDQ